MPAAPSLSLYGGEQNIGERSESQSPALQCNAGLFGLPPPDKTMVNACGWIISTTLLQRRNVMKHGMWQSESFVHSPSFAAEVGA
eukprot:6470186-Amphidinium_carterae.1